MKTPEWLQPGLYGAAIGAVALAVVGFTWGGWVTGSTASQLASDQARVEVAAALAPICIEQSRQDPQLAEKLAVLEGARNSFQRRDLIMETGWATMPGSTTPNRMVAATCAEELNKSL